MNSLSDNGKLPADATDAGVDMSQFNGNYSRTYEIIYQTSARAMVTAIVTAVSVSDATYVLTNKEDVAKIISVKKLNMGAIVTISFVRREVD